MYGPLQVAKVLVGNKCDLTNTRMIKTDQGKKLGKKIEASFMECSAKDVRSAVLVGDRDTLLNRRYLSTQSTNVDSAFLRLARELVAKR